VLRRVNDVHWLKIFILNWRTSYLDSVHQTLLQTHKNWLTITTRSNTTNLYFNANHTTNDYNLYEVAQHAFGHVFGLDHKTATTMKTNVMAPLPTPVKEELVLRQYAFTKKPMNSKFIY